MRFQIVTIDGTVIEADQFKTQEKGLKLERKSKQQEAAVRSPRRSGSSRSTG